MFEGNFAFPSAGKQNKLNRQRLKASSTAPNLLIDAEDGGSTFI
jgi:hypothetical protein